MFNGNIYFLSKIPLVDVLKLQKAPLSLWIGENYMDYYRPSMFALIYQIHDYKFRVSVRLNATFEQGIFDSDNFNYVFDISDKIDRFTYEEHISRMTTMLHIFWENNMPTCTPGMAEELPNEGGESGPVPWEIF